MVQISSSLVTAFNIPSPGLFLLKNVYIYEQDANLLVGLCHENTSSASVRGLS